MAGTTFHSTRRLILVAALGATMPLWTAAPVRAEVLVTMTREDVVFVDEADAPMPLNVAGATLSPPFAVPAGAQLIVSYSAECANDAFSPFGGLSISIRLINAETGAVTELRPTRGYRGFCGSLGRSQLTYGRRMVAVDAVAAGLPAGSYRAQVNATTSEGTRGRLSYSTLIVWH
jgi:hypothetical protein